jgi:hypothetical protein
LVVAWTPPAGFGVSAAKGGAISQLETVIFLHGSLTVLEQLASIILRSVLDVEGF